MFESNVFLVDHPGVWSTCSWLAWSFCLRFNFCLLYSDIQDLQKRCFFGNKFCLWNFRIFKILHSLPRRERQSNSELKFHQIVGKSRIGTLLRTFTKTYKNNHILIFLFSWTSFSKTCSNLLHILCIFLILSLEMYQL